MRVRINLKDGSALELDAEDIKTLTDSSGALHSVQIVPQVGAGELMFVDPTQVAAITTFPWEEEA